MSRTRRATQRMASLLALSTSVRPLGARRLVHQLGNAQRPQLGAQLLGRGGHQASELVDSPDPVLACATTGDTQHPDGLHAAVLRLGSPLARPDSAARAASTASMGIGLAGPPALLAVGPIDLDDAHTLVVQVAGQAGP